MAAPRDRRLSRRADGSSHDFGGRGRSSQQGDRAQHKGVVMHEYKVEITREGRWWMVHIPEIDGLTQARRLTEAPTMAREYIALDCGIPLREINVEVTSVRIKEPDFRELLESATQIKHLRAQANELEKESSERAREYAHWLVSHGVPVRDIAALLEISPQRVSQLANS